MDRLKKRLSYLKKDKDPVKHQWNELQGSKQLSTREKLEKLVKRSLKQKSSTRPKTSPVSNDPNGIPVKDSYYIENDYFYPLDTRFGRITLSDWKDMLAENLAIICNDPELVEIDSSRIVFFDSETTGLSGGTGTLAFMLGFGFFSDQGFCVKIFTLTDLAREGEFLGIIDDFLTGHQFAATCTYNGKCFDFPLLETRYILQRKRFPLLNLPHIDLLFPARLIWKNTYESRRLGYLGERLFGISREEDVDGMLIPNIYFTFLRNGSPDVLDKVIEHNALDLVGLAALLILINNYFLDISTTSDTGEILGIASLHEKSGDLKRAKELLAAISHDSSSNQVSRTTLKKLSIITKKNRNFKEALAHWKHLSEYNEYYSCRELAVYYEHREKDFQKALEIVESGLTSIILTECQQADLNKRKSRLEKKISRLK